MLETRRYKVVPLTPVHVGSGTTIGPEEYYFDGRELVRFGTANTFGKMTDGERRHYEKVMDGADFLAGIDLVRNVAKRHASETTIYRVAIGDECKARLDVKEVQRDNAVQSMAHVGESGNALIPGTAIKGAIRTALLSERLAKQPAMMEQFGKQIRANSGSRLNVDSVAMERDVLHIGQNAMEADPFRFLTVRDLQVRASGFRVDRFQIVGRDGLPKTGNNNNSGIAIYGERLVAMADGMANASAGTLEIALEQQKQKNRDVKALLGNAVSIGWAELEESTRSFFLRRFEADRERFSPLFGWLKPTWLDVIRNNGLFLRVGRYSHFEAASLDGIRRGWQSMPYRGKAIESGSSRTVCTLQDGKDRAPMGWIWLVRTGGASA